MHACLSCDITQVYLGRNGATGSGRTLWCIVYPSCSLFQCLIPLSLVLIGQPSPENDNTIKDLLPEDAGIDHQTVHQLITVLMKFMAKDESSAESDISSAKAFNTVKRHLYVLLGYDQQEGCFMIAPQKMRVSTCFNAFIAGIAQVGEGSYYLLQLFLFACCWNGGNTAAFAPK